MDNDFKQEGVREVQWRIHVAYEIKMNTGVTGLMLVSFTGGENVGRVKVGGVWSFVCDFTRI